MLTESQVATRLPVGDLDRARRFYSEKLGLEPVEARPGGLCYRCGGGYFALFESAGARPAITPKWRGRLPTSNPL